MVQPNHYITRLSAFLKTFAGLILVSSYLAGIVELETAHESFHSPTPEEAHSLVNENDPCHRNLFHNDEQQGCHHQSHVSASNTCSLCGIAIHNEYASGSIVFASKLESTGSYSIAWVDKLFTIQEHLIPSRAPPVDVV